MRKDNSYGDLDERHGVKDPEESPVTTVVSLCGETEVLTKIFRPIGQNC